MDWWKLFTLLIAVSAIITTTDAVKKKIRIHLPQKVKHIHHHKKIYITNHPASSQYAPAYLPNAEGAVAVPTTVSLPSIANLVPVKSVELYDERPGYNIGGITPSASKLLPLYRARGYYGPQPNEWEEQEIDLVPPPEPTGPAYAPSAPAASSITYPNKRIKILKIKDTPRKKKIIRKRKPKRIINEIPSGDERPVSSFHEQFYSDLENGGTIRKIRKPKRVEKIIDGDTEHIHTYSEEHIHKLVYDDAPKQSDRLVPVEDDSYGGALASGSYGTPSHLEYASYNPRDVTHDHIFHDHGEIPPNMHLPRDSLGYPPKVSYTSSGLKIGGTDLKRQHIKSNYPRKRPARPSADFTYYENMYTNTGAKKVQRPQSLYDHHSEFTSEGKLKDFRPVPAIKFNNQNQKFKATSYGNTKPYSGFHVSQGNLPEPFTTASNYNPTSSYSGVRSTPASFTNYREPIPSFKGSYPPNNYDYDTYPSSTSNTYKHGNGQLTSWPTQDYKKKKSISTQNLNFGGQDHQTVVDHLAESSVLQPVMNESPGQVRPFESFDNSKPIETATSPAHYTITESSPAHEYYTAMALKAFEDQGLSMPEASNDNFQFAAAPSTDATTEPAPTIASSATPFRSPYLDDHQSEITTTEPSPVEYEKRKRARRRKLVRHSNYANVVADVEGNKENYPMGIIDQLQSARKKPTGRQMLLPKSRGSHPPAHGTRGVPKYGDKI